MKRQDIAENNTALHIETAGRGKCATLQNKAFQKQPALINAAIYNPAALSIKATNPLQYILSR